MGQGWKYSANISIVILISFHSNDGHAGGFDNFDFSLRFPAALSRFSPYADVAGVGGASAASKWQSSINPAGMAWEAMPAGTHFTASPQFSTVGFDAGTRLNVFTESLTADAAEAGRFLVSAAQVRSNNATDRSGLDYAFDLDLGQVAWGKRFSPQWAAGFAFTYDRSHTKFNMEPLEVSHTGDETYSAKLGVHYLASPGLHLGLVFEQAVTSSNTDYFDISGTGTGTIRVQDTTWQTIVRPGIAYEYAPQSTIYADYQLGNFSNSTGTMTVNRFFAGIEQKIFEGVFLRVGSNADAFGNIGWTAGVGFYPTPAISLDFGFQDNNFPELEDEFGRSRTFAFSGSISF
jgi:hypothetical protein